MSYEHTSAAADRTNAAHIKQLLDEVLKETFPTSDPVAPTVEWPVGEARPQPTKTIIHTKVDDATTRE